ncbi:MAG: lipopolysaccharide biosynthesis protein [Gemmatimonadaceae bacterium]
MHQAPPPASWRNKVLRDTAMLNGAALTAQGAGVVQSLIVMRLLEPSVYGIWLGLFIILTYGGLAHFGTEHGIELRLPYFRGKSQSARGNAMADSVFLFWTFSTLFVAAGVAVYALASKHSSPLVREGLLAIALLLPLNQQANFHSRWQGAALTDFKLSSVLSVLQSWVSLLLIAPLVYFMGLRGLMIGTVLVSALVCVVWLRASAYRFRGRWSTRLVWQALRVGLPMTLVVLGGGLIQTIDRLVILSVLGATSLGYYAVTGLGGGIVYGLMAQAGSAMSPHISAEMGRSRDSPQSLERFLVVPTIVFAYLSTFAIAVLIIVIPALVTLWLPKYSPGLGAFLIYIPGFYFLGIIITANTILTLVLIARRRQRLVLYVQAGAIALEGGLAFVLLKSGSGLRGAAIASTIAYAVYGLAILSMAGRQVLGSRALALQFVGRVLVPFVAIIPIMILAHNFSVSIYPNRLIPGIAIQTAVLAIITAPMLPVFNRQVRFRPLAIELRNSLRARLENRR